VPVIRLLGAWTAASSTGCEFGVLTQDNRWDSLGEVAIALDGSPSLATFHETLFLAFQGEGGSLNVASYSRSATMWSEPVCVGKRIMSESPRLVVHEGLLWAFYQGPKHDRYIWFATSPDGVTWTICPDRIPKTRLSSSPGPLVFKDRLYVFHQGIDGDGYLWFTSRGPDGAWAKDTRLEGVRMTDSPSGTVFGDRMYVFHQGVEKNEELWYTSSGDGIGWRADAQIGAANVLFSPAAVVANEALQVVFNQGDKKLGLSRSIDGFSWQTTEVTGAALVDGPSVANF
jgi:hypothetical protein